MSVIPSTDNPKSTLSTHKRTLRAELYKTRKIATLLLSHVVFGIGLYQFPNLSSLHVYVILAWGVIWAASKPQIYAAYVAAYIVGAEVLWRMTEARFFWEGAKYAIVAILTLSLLKKKKKPLPVTVLFYFLFLLPSTILTLNAFGVLGARDAISFNLSGPLTLLVSVWFFSNIRIDSNQFITILTLLAAPILTTATYAVLSTLTATQIRWASSSMFQTSGGFGPNQVSTIMGLGLVSVLIMLLIENRRLTIRLILVGISTLLFAQGILTFSRGGMLAAAITLVVIVVHMAKKRRLRIRITLLSMIMVPFLVFVVLPALSDFTQGFLEKRFTDTDLTGRDEILVEELRLFQDNLLVGVGPGVGNNGRRAAAHTEMTRLLAEHGLLGAISLTLLLIMPLRRYLSSDPAMTKGIRLGWMVWALLVMTNAAMRLSAVSFMYGFAFAHFEIDELANGQMKTGVSDVE